MISNGVDYGWQMLIAVNMVDLRCGVDYVGSLENQLNGRYRYTKHDITI